MPHLVSNCCGCGVVTGTKREYPLGGRTYGESFLIDVCEDCKQECEAVMVCSHCGAEATSESPTFMHNNEERCYGCVETKEEALVWQ